MTVNKKTSRREAILQSLAQMLVDNKGERITTAKLAKEVGVSEAALYRHFPSKARMYEGLIEFIEETIFSRINTINQDQIGSVEKCGQIAQLVLLFAEKNPGFARLLTGDALAEEPSRLQQRVAQLFDRLETQLKQILRESALTEGQARDNDPAISASLLLSYVEGRLQQFVRSDFAKLPMQQWPKHWELLQGSL